MPTHRLRSLTQVAALMPSAGGGSVTPAFGWINRIGNTFQPGANTMNIGSTDANGANGTFTSGDLLIAVAVAAKSPYNADLGTFTGMSGWTQLYNAYTPTGNRYNYGVWWKLAGGSESGSYACSWTTSSVYGWMLVDYTTPDGSAPIDVSASADSGITTTPSSPSVTPTFTKDILLSIYTNFGDQGAYTIPSGMTSRQNVRHSTNGCDINLAELQLASASATGTKQWTTTGNQADQMISIAIKGT